MNLRRAFHRSVYVFGGHTLRVGQRAVGLPGHWVVLTAWNPGGRRRPEGWNRRMQRALDERLRGTRRFAGWGGLPGWREAHVLVQLDPRRGRVLARRFRQAAILVAGGDRPIRLVWITMQARQDDPQQAEF